MKKTTASVEQAVVIILQSVRRTRSRRRDFCVQMGFGVCTNKHPLAKWIARGRRDFCVQMGFGVCTNKHPLAKWIARGLACWYTVTDEIKNISSRMVYGCAGSENIVT